MADERGVAGLAPAGTPGGGDFDTFYNRTSGCAYGLALRIAGAPGPAAAACEAAYVRAWREGQGGLRIESALLEQVREEALRLRGPLPGPESGRSGVADQSYNVTVVMRAALAQVEPTGRRAIELAFFGGVGVADIAELLGEPVATVRTAMRAALLRIGELTRTEGETTT